MSHSPLDGTRPGSAGQSAPAHLSHLSLSRGVGAHPPRPDVPAAPGGPRSPAGPGHRTAASLRGGAALVSRPRPAGDDRHPQLPRRAPGDPAGRGDPPHNPTPTACESSSPTTPAARSTWRRSRGSTASTSSPARPTAGLPSTPTAACGPPTPSTTWSCSTPTSHRCATGWPACSTPPAATAPPGSPAPSCCTRTTGSSTPARSATPARPSGLTTDIAASRPTGDPPTSPARRSPPPVPACTSAATLLDAIGLLRRGVRDGL